MKRIWQHMTGVLVALFALMPYALLAEPVPVFSYTRNYSALTVKPGDVVNVTASVERSNECSSTVTRQWIDVQGNTVGEITTEFVDTLPAGVEEYHDLVHIPHSVLPGPLRYRVKTIFYCNFLQRLLGMGATFVMPDVIFTVQNTEGATNG